MKKTCIKILSVVLCAVMVLGAAPLSGLVGLDLPSLFDFKAEAATYSGTCGDNLTWSLDTETGVLNITGTGTMTNWSDSSAPWYWYSSKIKTVNIASGVTSIGSYAFCGCTSLTSVTIPDSATTIGDWAFAYCYSLTSVTIPDSVTSICDEAFCNCDSLTSVTIPDSVTSIGDSAFALCDSLTNITVDADNKYYSSDSYGVLFNKDKTILIQYPVGNTRTSYKIPDRVTTIDDDAFYLCYRLTSVTIGNSVKTIGNYAFYYCYRLTSVTIPDSVTTIGDYAFESCRSLTSIVIPDNVTTIGAYAFAFCISLTSVTIGNSVTTIGEVAFHHCDSLTSVTIPDSVTTIGELAFEGCYSLTSITVDEDNKYFSSNSDGVLFNKDKTTLIQYPIGNTRTSYTIPDSVTTIGDDAFRECTNLKSVTIPDSVTTIGDDAFNSCDSLTSVTIPDSVTTIGDYAFAWCESLTSVTIGNSVTTIGDYAFAWCESLTDVYYTGTEAQWNKISIGLYNDPLLNATIHYNFTESEHVHTPVTVTIPASCTVNGMKYTVCEDCGETIGEPTVIPAGHTPGEWETIYEPTYEADGLNVKKCTVCGATVESEAIPKLIKKVAEDEETGIKLEYKGEDYDGEVKIDVSESFDGAAFNLINTETNSTQTFIYDITMTVDGENVQPKGKVTVRIPLPENYDPARTFVYHVNTATGKVEPMSAKYEDGFMVFETDHFSYYAIVEQLDVKLAIKQPTVTTINYGETLVLQLEDVELPEGWKVEWSIIGNAVTMSVSDDGKECRVTSTASGNVSVRATVVDENGEPVLNAEGGEIFTDINIKSNASFWQKIVSFFKNLFRINRIIY